MFGNRKNRVEVSGLTEGADPVAVVVSAPEGPRKRNAVALMGAALAAAVMAASPESAEAQTQGLRGAVQIARGAVDGVQRDRQYQGERRELGARRDELARRIAHLEAEQRMLADYVAGRDIPAEGYRYTITLADGRTEVVMTGSEMLAAYRNDMIVARRELEARRITDSEFVIRREAVRQRVGERQVQIRSQIAELERASQALREERRAVNLDRVDNALAAADSLLRVLDR